MVPLAGVGGLRISENGSTHDHDERIAQAPRMQEDMGIRRSQPESAELETVSSQQARSSGRMFALQAVAAMESSSHVTHVHTGVLEEYK